MIDVDAAIVDLSARQRGMLSYAHRRAAPFAVTLEELPFANSLIVAGLLRPWHDPRDRSVMSVVITDAGEAVAKALIQLRKAECAARGEYDSHLEPWCKRRIDCEWARAGRCGVHGFDGCPDCNC